MIVVDILNRMSIVPGLSPGKWVAHAPLWDRSAAVRFNVTAGISSKIRFIQVSYWKPKKTWKELSTFIYDWLVYDSFAAYFLRLANFTVESLIFVVDQRNSWQNIVLSCYSGISSSFSQLSSKTKLISCSPLHWLNLQNNLTKMTNASQS